MTKKLQVSDEVFEYPEQGDLNWAEGATGWAEKITEVVSNVVGPDDILLREAPLVNGQLTPANINGLTFDASRVQQTIVEGLLIREYTVGSGKPLEAESFRAEGVYTGTDFIISVSYDGNEDVGVILDVDATGQFTYTSEDKTDTDTLTIKFRGQAISDN